MIDRQFDKNIGLEEKRELYFLLKYYVYTQIVQSIILDFKGIY